MPLNSIHFIFLFLPITLLLFYILPFRYWRNAILVLASLFFFSWGDPTNLPVFILIIVANYGFGLLIGLFIEKHKLTASRILTWFAVIANLAFLGFYKYLGFLGDAIISIIPIEINVLDNALPLGISYFTFSSIGYILDIYRGTEKVEKNILRFMAYLTMFPKLLQGPIARFKDVKSGLLKSHFTVEGFIEGARRLIIGLAKKVLLADSLSIVADRVFDGSISRMGADLAWFGLIAYTLQIYFDFAGYTDMAIGLGYMFGFKLPENFNFPYVSRSIADFWRRWHMSLTAWFRTYVFLPLEYKRKKAKHLRLQTDIIIVFLLTGLWHGAGWNYLIWGGYFGFILAIESGPFGKWLKKIPLPLQHFYSLFLIMLGWIFFRINDIHDWVPFFNILLGGNGWTGKENLRSWNILMFFPLMVLGVLLSTPLIARIENQFIQNHRLVRAATDLLYIGIFIVSIAYILSNGFTTFLYVKF